VKFRHRIAAVVANWVKNHFYDFKLSYDVLETATEKELQKKLFDFVGTLREQVSGDVD
tara:strand:+ start:191 stop:364 length:174 start_codon:yes stop_codon:yes gene_type:complete